MVQQAVLLAVFVLAGWGVARLVPSGPAAAAAALGYVWTPYLAERLVIGHWTYLLGYALLPWVTGAALAARRGGRLAPLLLWLGAAALAGATSALLATGMALAVLAFPARLPGGERAGGPAGGAAGRGAGVRGGGNAAWLVPALTRPGGLPADPTGVAAFAARADTPLGLAGSLITLGGIWNPAAWPPAGTRRWPSSRWPRSRAALALGPPPAAGPTGPRTAGGGRRRAGARRGRRRPGLTRLLAAVVEHVPGGGLLRDGQKLLAPAALLVALAAGYAVAGWPPAAARSRTRSCSACCRCSPCRRSAGGRRPAGPGRLPAVLERAAGGRRRRAAGRGRIAALDPYRRLDFAGDRVVLDPLPRLLDRRVLVDDDLALSTATVRGRGRPLRAGHGRAGRRPPAAGAAARGRRPVRRRGPRPARPRPRRRRWPACRSGSRRPTCCWSSCRARWPRPRRAGPGGRRRAGRGRAGRRSREGRPTAAGGCYAPRQQASDPTVTSERATCKDYRPARADQGAILIPTCSPR